MDDDKGILVALAHTDKEFHFFDSIKDRIVYEKSEINKILPSTSDSRKFVAMHLKRDKLQTLVSKEFIYEYNFEVRRYNVGNKLEFL